MIAIYAVSAIVAFGGAALAVWSIIDTRRKFYEEYRQRKNK